MGKSKLTLSIDSEVIRRAKLYVKKQGVSVSDLVENYLKLLTTDIRKKEEKGKVKEPKEDYGDILKLRGSFKLDDDRDYKEIISDVLWEKYMKGENE